MFPQKPHWSVPTSEAIAIYKCLSSMLPDSSDEEKEESKQPDAIEQPDETESKQPAPPPFLHWTLDIHPPRHINSIVNCNAPPEKSNSVPLPDAVKMNQKLDAKYNYEEDNFGVSLSQDADDRIGQECNDFETPECVVKAQKILKWVDMTNDQKKEAVNFLFSFFFFCFFGLISVFFSFDLIVFRFQMKLKWGKRHCSDALRRILKLDLSHEYLHHYIEFAIGALKFVTEVSQLRHLLSHFAQIVAALENQEEIQDCPFELKTRVFTLQQAHDLYQKEEYGNAHTLLKMFGHSFPANTSKIWKKSMINLETLLEKFDNNGITQWDMQRRTHEQEFREIYFDWFEFLLYLWKKPTVYPIMRMASENASN